MQVTLFNYYILFFIGTISLSCKSSQELGTKNETNSDLALFGNPNFYPTEDSTSKTKSFHIATHGYFLSDTDSLSAIKPVEKSDSISTNIKGFKIRKSYQTFQVNFLPKARI